MDDTNRLACVRIEDPVISIGVLALAALVVSRYPRETGAMLEALLSTSAQKSAQEREQAYHDLLSRWSLIETERVIGQCRYGQGDDDHHAIAKGSSDGRSGFLRLHFFRLDVAPSLNQWSQLLRDWSECSDGLFMVGNDDFRFAVRNSRLGRGIGVVRIHWLFLKGWIAPKFKGGAA